MFLGFLLEDLNSSEFDNRGPLAVVHSNSNFVAVRPEVGQGGQARNVVYTEQEEEKEWRAGD